MTEDQKEIRRKKRVLEYAEKVGNVSRQLGHADLSVSAQHYATRCGGGEYRAPLTLDPGEVPADLLARLNSTTNPQHRGPWKPPTVASPLPKDLQTKGFAV